MNSEAVYEIYVDVLYGNCVVMNYLILTMTGVFLGRSATRPRKILTSMLCAGITLILILLPWVPSGLRMILGYGACEILALILTYRIKESDELLRGVICMYLLTFLYGGCLSFLNDRVPYLKEHGYTMLSLILVGCVCCEVIRLLHNKLKKSKEHRQRLYRVNFCWRGKAYSCIALYDTGNQLYEPLTKCPVCIVEQTILQPAKEQYEAAIPYHSVGCQGGMLYGIYAETFEVRPKETCEQAKKHPGDSKERVLLAVYPGAVSGRGEYQMILHPDIISTEREF